MRIILKTVSIMLLVVVLAIPVYLIFAYNGTETSFPLYAHILTGLIPMLILLYSALILAALGKIISLLETKKSDFFMPLKRK